MSDDEVFRLFKLELERMVATGHEEEHFLSDMEDLGEKVEENKGDDVKDDGREEERGNSSPCREEKSPLCLVDKVNAGTQKDGDEKKKTRTRRRGANSCQSYSTMLMVLPSCEGTLYDHSEQDSQGIADDWEDALRERQKQAKIITN